jgi:mannosylglycerate hydrolase
VLADAAFGPVERVPVDVPKRDQVAEMPPPTAPLHRWVALFGGAGGAAVHSDGLAEYEATPDGTVAVTLVRAVGELSRADLPERPGHAGWPAPTPLAQCEGAFSAVLALQPHGALDDATLDFIERTSDDVLVPLRGDTLRDALEAPPPLAGPELVGRGLALGAVKPGIEDGWTVLRCLNVTRGEVAGAWRLPRAPVEAWLARLDEHRLAPLGIDGDAIPIIVPPRGDLTILVR